MRSLCFNESLLSLTIFHHLHRISYEFIRTEEIIQKLFSIITDYILFIWRCLRILLHLITISFEKDRFYFLPWYLPRFLQGPLLILVFWPYSHHLIMKILHFLILNCLCFLLFLAIFHFLRFQCFLWWLFCHYYHRSNASFICIFCSLLPS